MDSTPLHNSPDAVEPVAGFSQFSRLSSDEPQFPVELGDDSPGSLAEGLSDDGPAEQTVRRNRRLLSRLRLPLILFLLTCASTFVVGCLSWQPELLFPANFSGMLEVDSQLLLRRQIYSNWRQGATYMVCVLAILLAHEMGHFVATLIHRVRATFPFFIPFPLSPLGTMGAVIGMEAHKADRRQIFDIGLAGPLAGLVVAIPILWMGIQQLDLDAVIVSERTFDLPLALRYILPQIRPGFDPTQGIHVEQMNGYFMAAWVGLLVTGLNMMPVSQLDGGHVTFALFGRGAHWIARGFMVFVFAYFAYSGQYNLIPMALLVLLIGVDHPPTSDDTQPLGWFRTGLGCLSLLIPVFGFAPQLILQSIACLPR